MRTLFVIGLLLVCAFMAGWFTVHRDDEGTTIRINRDEIRSDARQAIDRGRQYLDRDGNPVPQEQVAQQPYESNGQQPGYPQGYQPQFQQPQTGYQQQPDPGYNAQPQPARQY